MNTTPPVLPPPVVPPPATKTFFHRAADYGAIVIGGSILLNIVGGKAPAVAMLAGLLLLSALPAGVIALCGIPRHGRKGLLVKGLFALLFPIVLIALAVPAFLKVKRASEERTRQQIERR